MAFYHGGIAGKREGDMLVPSPPHVTDGCPVCVARAAGRVCTVREFKAWLLSMPPSAQRDKALKAMDGAPMDAPVDPPSEVQAIYMTTHLQYATWYAARSKGDLYLVDPCGPLTRSETDHFPSFTAPSARVLKVLRQNVALTRRERRTLDRMWKKADVLAERAKAGQP